MTIDIVCAGRTPASYEQEWLDDYLLRAKKLSKVSLTRIRERPAATPEKSSLQTWSDLKARLPDRSRVILLDPKGKLFSTDDFVTLLKETQRSSTPRLAFVVGGAYGLPDEARNSAHTLLSLSKLTLPHRLALLVLLEQIYRALSIQAGSPYAH